MPFTARRRVWTRQPQHPRQPVGNWRCVVNFSSLADIRGTATPTLASGAILRSTPWGMAAQTGINSKSAYVNLGSSTAIQLDVQSGVLVFIPSITTNPTTLFTTSDPAIGFTGGFCIRTLTPGLQIELSRHNAAGFLTTSNAVVQGGLNVVAWSYNATTGRARCALNGVLTSATGAETFAHGPISMLGRFRTADTALTEPADILLFALSPDEEFSDAALISRSLNPWQIFAPANEPVFYSLGSSGLSMSYRSRVWTRQPQYPVALAPQYSHPDAQAMVAGVGLRGPLARAGTAFVAGGVGGLATGTDGNNGSYFDIGPAPKLNPGAATFVVVVSLPTTGRGWASWVSGTVSNATAYIEDITVNGWEYGYQLGATGMVIRSDGGATREAYTGDVGLADGRPHTIVWQIVSATEFACWVDGVKRTVTYVSTATLTNNTGALDYSPYLHMRNVRGSPGNPAEVLQRIYAYVRLPYLLKNPEEISRNPWLLFAPAIEPVFYSLGAGGGGNTYNESSTDTVSAADTITAILTAGGSVADAAAATDTVSSLMTLAAAVAETATATDSVSAVASVIRSFTDSVSATDSLIGRAGAGLGHHGRHHRHGLVRRDQGAGGGHQRLHHGERLGHRAVLFAGAISDAVTLLDSPSALGVFVNSLVETALAADTITSAASMIAAVAEAASASFDVDASVGGGSFKPWQRNNVFLGGGLVY